jgi:hypothetical protein
MSFTTFTFSSINGSEISIVWNKISDSILSSSVDLKAFIKEGGRSCINQTVSFKRIFLHIDQLHCCQLINPSSYGFKNSSPTDVPNVANNLSSAKTHFFVKAFNNEDFQALVYHTIPTVCKCFFSLHFLCCSLTFS